MDTVIDVITKILVVVVLGWVLIFGGLGAVLAKQRGGSSVLGGAWGALLGPIGWIVVYFTTRSERPVNTQQDDIWPEPEHEPEF